jgi:hypothetical protein
LAQILFLFLSKKLEKNSTEFQKSWKFNQSRWPNLNSRLIQGNSKAFH